MITKTVLGLLLIAMNLSGNTEAVQEKTSYDPDVAQSQVGRPVVKFPTEGGTKGAPFDDLKKISSTVFNIHSIAIISSEQVDSIQVTYKLKNGSLFKAPKHGRGSNPPFAITLAADEYISKVEGSTNGAVINQITITTKRPEELQTRVYGPFGKTAGHHNFTLTESFILGFLGKSSDHLNSIGIYCLAPVKMSDTFGWYGVQFTEHPDDKFPPVVKVSKILVYHGWVIDSIQFQYQLHGGGKRMGEKHGGNGGNLTTIQISPDDQLIGAEGLLDGGTFSDLKQVIFTTQKKSNGLVTVHHGPFGNLGDKPFSMQGHIVAYAGSAHSDVFDCIAFYYY